MDCSWQTVAVKRPRPSSPTTENSKEPKKVRSENRFAILDAEKHNDEIHDNDKNDNELATTSNNNNNQEEALKPPPIIFPNVTDIGKMLRSIRDEIGDNFTYKVKLNNEIRLMIKKLDDYRKLIKILDSAKILYHTYQLKSERSFRFIIKGLHSSTSVETIKAYLNFLGHSIRFVKNALSRIDKRPLNMFFVDLDPNPNNKDVYQIKSIDNAIVTIEPVKKANDMALCYRCQEIGHTQNYCKKSFRCVKCSLGHRTSECTLHKKLLLHVCIGIKCIQPTIKGARYTRK